MAPATVPETNAWSWRYEAGCLAFTLAGGVAMAGLGGIAPGGIALVAAMAAQVLALTLGRVAGAKGRYVPGLLMFVGAFALAEAREGRGTEHVLLVPMLCALALLRIRLSFVPRQEGKEGDWNWLGHLALPFLLILLGLYSGGSGGAGQMEPWFGWMSADLAGNAILVLRKTIHALFYGGLALAALDAFRRVRPDHRANAPWAFALAAIFSVFDEARQAGVAGRTGQASDVLLDLVAAALVLWLVARRVKLKG